MQIHRVVNLPIRGGFRSYTCAFAMAAELKSGETTIVDIERMGRPVTGKVLPWIDCDKPLVEWNIGFKPLQQLADLAVPTGDSVSRYFEFRVGSDV